MSLTLDSQTIAAINSSEIESYYLYEILFDITQPPIRIASWSEDIVYEGNLYSSFSVNHNDIGVGTDGAIRPVTLTVGNIDSARVIQQLIENYDLIGKQVKIIQLITNSYSGDINKFTNTFNISGATATSGQVTFTLDMSFDVFKTVIPARKIYAQFCNWQFGDANCTLPIGSGDCQKTWQNCKDKGNQINFGGFPAVQDSFVIL